MPAAIPVEDRSGLVLSVAIQLAALDDLLGLVINDAGAQRCEAQLCTLGVSNGGDGANALAFVGLLQDIGQTSEAINGAPAAISP